MTRTFAVLAVALAFVVSTNALAVNKAYRNFKLPNGMELVAMESHKVPLVTIVLSVKAGGFTEAPDTNGLTHLWEHMFFKGNARLKNQEAFSKRIRQLGISYNGDTAAEKVRYYFTLPSVYLEEGLQFMADAISTPLLEKTELEKERQVVINEYDRNASQPGFDFYNLRENIIYGDRAYLRDALGYRHIIEKATREQLLKMKDHVFVPSNSALMVSGSFDTKKLIALAKKYFSHWKDPKGWKKPTPPPFQKFPKTTEFVMTREHVKMATTYVTFQGPRARHDRKDSFAADVLISLLKHLSGKFYKKYVDSGLTYGSGLSYYTQSQAGELSLYASTKAKDAMKVKKMLLAEVKEWLKPGYFTKEQLEDVRRNLLIDHKREINEPSAYIKSLAFWWPVTGFDYYDSYIENLRRTGFKEVYAFIKRYMVNKPYLAATLLSPEDAKKVGLKDNSGPLMAKHLKAYKKPTKK